MGDAVTTLLGSDYPGGTLMQFQQWGIPNLEQTVSEYLDARDGVTGDESVIIAREAAIKRADYLRSGTTRRLLPTTDTTLTDSLCAWTLKIPLKFKNPLSPGNERVIPPFLIELMGRKSKALLLFKNRWTTIY